MVVVSTKEDNEMKNAMFQYYDGQTMIDDTGLISLDDALELFESRKESFASSLSVGLDCQMCIWHECNHDCDYRVAYKDWHSSNVKYDNGHFWVKE